jgi:hypothetical protein
MLKLHVIEKEFEYVEKEFEYAKKNPIIVINKETFIKKCNDEIKVNINNNNFSFIINEIEYIECEEKNLSNIWLFNSNNIFFVTINNGLNNELNNEFYLLLIKPLYN